MSSYIYGTILKRVEPFEDDDEWAAYNEIKIVGNSLVSESTRSEEWTGQGGEAITIQPVASFGATIDRPRGELERDYEIVSFPEGPGPVTGVGTVKRAGMQPPAADGPSPEEQFRKQAQDEARAKKKG